MPGETIYIRHPPKLTLRRVVETGLLKENWITKQRLTEHSCVFPPFEMCGMSGWTILKGSNSEVLGFEGQDNFLKLYSLSNFQINNIIINFSCHTVLYIHRTYLFITKFLHFDPLHPFHPPLLPYCTLHPQEFLSICSNLHLHLSKEKSFFPI